MIWVLKKPSRKGALLKLLFVHGDGLVGEGMIGGCLAHSDHETIAFKNSVHMGKIVSRAAALDCRRDNLVDLVTGTLLQRRR